MLAACPRTRAPTAARAAAHKLLPPPPRPATGAATKTKMTMTVPLSLPAAVLIPVLGGMGVATQMDKWYPSLRKPAWTPPNWAFPVAWTALYALMGGASWLVWREGGVGAHPLPLALYAAQLGLNWAWSPLFFGAHKLRAALLDALLQLACIAACIATFYPVSHTAAYLMLPLLPWVSFATALNTKILALNRGRKLD